MFEGLKVRKFEVRKVGFRFALRLVAVVASLTVRRFQTSNCFKFEGLKVSEIESLRVWKFESSKDWKFAKFEGLKRVEMESSKVRRVSSSNFWEFASLKVRDSKVSEFEGPDMRSRVWMLFANSVLYLKHAFSFGDSGSPYILSIHPHLAIRVIIAPHRIS